jgi:hypothetical protein
MPVLASGLAPRPPPVFDPAAFAGVAFDPPLAKEGPKKVLRTGLPPQPPPPANDPKGEFSPPLQSQSPPRLPTIKTVPKVLASGLEPKPPPVFETSGVSHGEFDPPITFADCEEPASEEPATDANGASASYAPTTAAASAEPAGNGTDADSRPSASLRQGYRIKRKAPS